MDIVGLVCRCPLLDADRKHCEQMIRPKHRMLKTTEETSGVGADCVGAFPIAGKMNIPVATVSIA